MSRHRFTKIAPHVHWLSPDSSTDRPTLGAISGSRGTLIVDAGASPDHAATLRRAIAAAELPAPAFVALTHWHWDHVFGTCAWELPTFAHVETRRIVAEMATLDWSDAALDERVAAGTEIAFCRDMLRLELPDRSERALRPPDIAFSGTLDLDLGDVTARLVHVGGDHAHDSVVVYVPEERIVFLGDAAYPAIYGGPRRMTTAALFPLLDRLLDLEAAWYLGGHDPEPIAREAFAADAALLRAIGGIVETTRENSQALRAALGAAFGDITEDHADIADEFLAGIGLPPHARSVP